MDAILSMYEYSVIQNMVYGIIYPNKYVSSHQNGEVTSILSGYITVLRFWWPYWLWINTYGVRTYFIVFLTLINVCSYQSCDATSILSGDITVLRF